MQTTGMTNDHLICCYRFEECIDAASAEDQDDAGKAKVDEKPEDLDIPGLGRAMDELVI